MLNPKVQHRPPLSLNSVPLWCTSGGPPQCEIAFSTLYRIYAILLFYRITLVIISSVNIDHVLYVIEPSGHITIDFHSNTGFNTYAFDIYAFRTLTAPTNPNRLDVIVGVKTGRMKTTQSQGFNQRAF